MAKTQTQTKTRIKPAVAVALVTIVSISAAAILAATFSGTTSTSSNSTDLGGVVAAPTCSNIGGTCQPSTVGCPSGTSAQSAYCQSGTTCCVPACKDSDGGKNYYLKGSVATGGQLYTDFCYNYGGTGSTYTGPCQGKDGCVLVELSCNTDGTALKEKYDCPNGCQDGACVKPSAPLYGAIHTEADCTNNGGAVVLVTGSNIPGSVPVSVCKFPKTCLAGWKAFSNWTTTTANKCVSPFSCTPASYSTACTTGSHAWSNVAPEKCGYYKSTVNKGRCTSATCAAVVAAQACY